MAVGGEMAYSKRTSWVSLSTAAIALAPFTPIWMLGILCEAAEGRHRSEAFIGP